MTDRQTDATWSVTIGRINVGSTAMRPNNAEQTATLVSCLAGDEQECKDHHPAGCTYWDHMEHCAATRQLSIIKIANAMTKYSIYFLYHVL